MVRTSVKKGMWTRSWSSGSGSADTAMKPVLLICVFFLAGCPPPPMTQHPSSSQQDTLAARLSSCNVKKMAQGLSMDPQVNAVWNDAFDASLYSALVEDRARSDALRFAAALVLL